MATERLPMRHIREILRLKWTLKRSHRDTARRLGISPGAVASVISRATAIGLTRARESAKKDQLRARNRLGKFLLRQGRRPPTAMQAWTQRHLTWVKTVHFEHAAQEATLLDYLHEVEHMTDRIERLERAIDDAVTIAPE